MTVHMVKFYIEPPNGNAETAVDNWVMNHTEWMSDPQEHTLREVPADPAVIGSPMTVTGTYRFLQEEPASDLLDDLEARLQSFQGGLWYRVGYHECSQDEENPTPCSWEQTRENGSVPDDIPELI